MRRDRADIRVGVHLEGGHCPVEKLVPLKRDGIQQGVILQGGEIKNHSAPPADLGEIGARMDKMREQLTMIATTLRAAKR
jgi:hypothetical protein